MARPTTQLTATQIKEAKSKDKNYKLFDGGGLFLEVTPTGNKSWKLKYRFENKEKKYTIGKYPSISLATARQKREELKTLIAEGIDPNEKKKQDKQLQELQKNKETNTFKKLALQRLEKVQEDISESHYKRMMRGFVNDVFPFIGAKPIDDVTADDIIDIMQRMEKRGVKESARKLYQAISKTYKWAVSNRYAKRNPANDIDLNELLGKRQVTHHATFTDDVNISRLLFAIEKYQGEITTKHALKLMAYTSLRTANIVEAEWSEIDFRNKQWNIPARKMKTRSDHIVPLTNTTLKIFEEMREYTGKNKYIFTGTKGKNTHIGSETPRNAIRNMGFTSKEFTPHGFRAMFSSIAHEKSPFKYEVIEVHLAHSIGNSVSKAYNRAKYLDERRELMQWWSDYLNGVISNET
ncbi:integrase arm-type DNA-binding domain-containing protein [Sulfurimonas sp. C5]|uniref:tyrosine-type recombinase/integrase n=1 Tax=Sulfurimonas sp. C5 TaxID=3036947 RepID=UPI002454C49C|nr:integrase arm-type DNA-binding domain-containing protein [Sulfurimonas sp. C5]MDH4943521.1 integrase arm-type DNA-binding domain-containing protein [Sulfurimonas sp. C5]